MKRGEEVFPDEVHEGLHVGGAAGDGEDHVVFGEDETELAEGAIGAKAGGFVAPELIAVAVIPIAVGAAAGGRLAGAGGGGPRFGEKTVAVPVSFLEIEEAEFREVFGAD